jgi:hypothetical protein
MLLKSLFRFISLEEMEYTRIVSVPGQTVIHDAFFGLGKFSRFFVDSFDLIGVFGYGVDLESCVKNCDCFKRLGSNYVREGGDSQCHRHRIHPQGYRKRRHPSSPSRPSWRSSETKANALGCY